MTPVARELSANYGVMEPLQTKFTIEGQLFAQLGKPAFKTDSYDPHPAEGVSDPLSQVVRDFRFICLTKCGHYPWLEKHARARFFEILTGELAHLNPLEAPGEG